MSEINQQVTNMSLNASALKDKIKSATDNLDDPKKALDAFWDAVKDYIEGNAEPTYSWSAVAPTVPPTPDPTVQWVGKVKPSGKLELSKADTPESACSMLSGSMNTQIATWIIQPPSGFAVSPLLMIPAINISVSGATDRDSALLSLATDIITGIQGAHATPAVSGSHGSYVGGGSLIGVL